jgi:hypothetical protein
MEGSKATSLTPSDSPTTAADSNISSKKPKGSPTSMEGSKATSMTPSKRMTTTQMNIKIKSLENLLYQNTTSKQTKETATINSGINNNVITSHRF